ncbi:hypothetical protein LAUMK7_03959 [Mycobacterium kansasii]|uniref:Uncharacterized protein n=1 Tax=Mycobacterium kansasii TaxID=1768 RepID=A0A1V3WAM2_MYCKA|nr:hypothetical protein I547_4475 [Mycobacterium kansasii 824]OOK64027.1 hypothetical protein BZL29_8362 [Mycobacterium kansasii]VAZ63863.1 hypothetical protein LAUMK22_05705 [Mycobacterium kansasii]VAZ67844.1 hypothetical protein LAUMK40_03986 [Mycobacterium kansasii]VAZ77613.1 hypothetical protein LAUMK7_03959 [Mycobacterium kansasii]
MPACRDQAVARASQSIAHRCGLPAKVAEKTILTCGVRTFFTGIKEVGLMRRVSLISPGGLVPHVLAR